MYSCLVPGTHYSARTLRFGSRGPSEEVRRFPTIRLMIRHRSELTEKAWKKPYRNQARQILSFARMRDTKRLAGLYLEMGHVIT